MVTEAEREHHKRLDAMAAKCGERTEAGASHLGCAYCAYLARFYDEQRRTYVHAIPPSGRIR